MTQGLEEALARVWKVEAEAGPAKYPEGGDIPARLVNDRTGSTSCGSVPSVEGERGASRVAEVVEGRLGLGVDHPGEAVEGLLKAAEADSMEVAADLMGEVVEAGCLGAEVGVETLEVVVGMDAGVVGASGHLKARLNSEGVEWGSHERGLELSTE